VPSYEAGRRLVHDLGARAPRESRRLLWIDSAGGKSGALQLHRASPLPTVLVSPSLREGVDLPDDFLRFQVLTKLPYPDLGDPWTAARRERDPRWYAVETAKALLQAYGRSCRHADDHGVTYVLDGQFARFLQRYRVLLPEWFLDAAVPALRAAHPEQVTD
jgi:ATP-dependent DNA helicase DinG